MKRFSSARAPDSGAVGDRVLHDLGVGRRRGTYPYGLRETDPSLGAAVIAHGVVGVAEHTLRATRAREEERRLAGR
jgi:hypothetical protein